MSDDDDLDPANWLASQFGEEEPEKPQRRRGMPAATPPAAEPVTPPAQQQTPPTPPHIPAERYTPPAEPTPPAASGGGFSWGLTPGGSTPEPVVPPMPTPTPAPTPAPLVEPTAPVAPAADPLAVLFGQQPTAPVEPAPTPGGWDVPTVATPVQPEPPARVDPAPTVAFGGAELVRQEFPGFGASLDPAIEGVTEVFGAQPIGLGAPEDEGIEVNALDSLFGESKFVEYEDTLVPVLPARASGGELVVVDRPRTAPGARAPIPRTQKILMGAAGGLLSVLLLIVLFLAGQRIGASAPSQAAPVPTQTESAAPTVGPLPPGEYYWSQLLGGECIAPFTSPWEDTFTVVDCTQAHPAQLVLKGTFPATEDPDYPGVDALQKLAASLCTAPTVIDYAATASANDIQILASFAADEQDWLDGNRTFYCFANRTGGAEFTTSIAKPQPLPTAAPTVTETPAP